MLKLCVLAALAASCMAMYPSSSSVVELTSSNFDKLVLKGDEIWIVEFYAPWCGHCQSFAPEYTKAANQLKGVVKVGAVNADDHKDLGGRFGVRGFPTVKIFGANKNKPEDFNGARTSQGLIDAALTAIKAKIGKAGGSSGSQSDDDVVELTDSNFDKLVLNSDDIWLVEFFAPWCGHCKNLAPHWSKAATELKGKVKLGALDATVHQATASKYGVSGYPTIKYFAPGSRSASSAQDYDGGRTSSDIVTWALDKLAASVPPPEVLQVVDEKAFKDNCESKPLCVVAVLPHILDCQSDCRNEYLKTLTEIGDKFKQKMWGWIWAEAGAQPELENALDIGGFGYPALAVVSPKKLKYTILRGSFSKNGITEFLRDLSYGRGNTAAVKEAQLPKIVKTEPWDGKDGELPQEEEIDLSDVDLNEKEEL